MPNQTNSRANGSVNALARSLGWFSIGLGVAELLAPRTLADQLGMRDKEALLRFYGARETVAGIGILMSDDPSPWIWGRVAGDALDLASLAPGLNDRNQRKSNVAIAIAAVAGVTALDCICAQALRSTAGEQGQLSRDYSDRSGFPHPPEEMRGVARKDFAAPGETRISEALHLR